MAVKRIIANIATAERLVRQAASRGAQIILIQELFETPYFCKDQDARHFALARPRAGNQTLARFGQIDGVVSNAGAASATSDIPDSDPADLDRDGSPSLLRRPFVQLVAIPLIESGEVLGVLHLERNKVRVSATVSPDHLGRLGRRQARGLRQAGGQ